MQSMSATPADIYTVDDHRYSAIGKHLKTTMVWKPSATIPTTFPF